MGTVVRTTKCDIGKDNAVGPPVNLSAEVKNMKEINALMYVDFILYVFVSFLIISVENRWYT